MGLRGTRPALAGRRKEDGVFALLARGFWEFAFNAHFGPVRLPLFRCAGGVGLCASRDRLWGGDGLVSTSRDRLLEF